MMRTSRFLTMLQASLDHRATVGLGVNASDLPDICELLRFCSKQCEEMEHRLAGVVVIPPIAPENVISLSAWLDGRATVAPSDDGAA